MSGLAQQQNQTLKVNAAKIEGIANELAVVRKDGKILPHDVVMRAKAPESALHEHFCWDDGEAAYRYRIEQARTLIRTVVLFTDHRVVVGTRAYVSLVQDRSKGGGYRLMRDVFADEELQDQLLHDALKDLQSAQRRYSRFKELGSVFTELDKATKAYERRPRVIEGTSRADG